MNNHSGTLYLVSVGIGDLDNMTIRARNIIEQADIVLAMQFIREQLADLLEGKAVYDAGHGLFTGSDINSGTPEDEEQVRAVIRDGIRDGKTVAVLDFGDPTLYSPQSAYLKEFSDLNPKIIPGISSFNAGNAALGRELTRAYDRAVILTEAMNDPDNPQPLRERLEKLAATHSTLVLFAMRLDLPLVAQELMRHYPADTPVAIVTHAGFSEQENVIRGTLETIAEQTRDMDLPWQHLLYVGDFLA